MLFGFELEHHDQLHTKEDYKQVTTQRNMLKILFLLMSTGLVNACPTKEKAIECFYSIADQNKDGHVTRTVLETVIDGHLPWWQRTPFHFFGGIDRIMHDCDANKDSVLTPTEAMALKNTCLETCFKRSAVAHVFSCPA